MAELWAATQREWQQIPAKVIANLIESMPRRIQMVITAREGSIRY